MNQGFDGNTSSAAPSPIQFLQEITPAGQEKLQVGQTVPITWRSGGISGPADTVNIDLIRDGDPNFSAGILAVDVAEQWLYVHLDNSGVPAPGQTITAFASRPTTASCPSP